MRASRPYRGACTPPTVSRPHLPTRRAWAARTGSCPVRHHPVQYIPSDAPHVSWGVYNMVSFLLPEPLGLRGTWDTLWGVQGGQVQEHREGEGDV